MLWDLNKCQLIRKLWQGTPGLACIAYTVRVTISQSTFTDCLQAEGLIYFGGSDRKFNALDVASGEVAKELRGHEDLVRTLVIKPELQRLVSGSYDQDVRVCSRFCRRINADPRLDLGPEERSMCGSASRQPPWHGLLPCERCNQDRLVSFLFYVSSMTLNKLGSTAHDATMAVQDCRRVRARW